jgi:hypothetical protein
MPLTFGDLSIEMEGSRVMPIRAWTIAVTTDDFASRHRLGAACWIDGYGRENLGQADLLPEMLVGNVLLSWNALQNLKHAFGRIASQSYVAASEGMSLLKKALDREEAQRADQPLIVEA